MPITLAVVGAVSGLLSVTVGAHQQNVAREQQKNLATGQMLGSLAENEATNKANITIGQGHDIATIYAATTQAVICGDTQLKINATKKSGDVLIIVGAGVIVLSLGILVLKNKAAVTA